MVFLFQDQNQGTRNETAHAKECVCVATVLFHPDFNRRLRNRTESADPSSQGDSTRGFQGRKALAGLGCRPYRRWGISPRPENIGRPEWANLSATMAEERDTSKPSAMGKRHVPMRAAFSSRGLDPGVARGLRCPGKRAKTKSWSLCSESERRLRRDTCGRRHARSAQKTPTNDRNQPGINQDSATKN